MKLRIEVDHPDEGYIWEILNKFIQYLPKERRVRVSLDLEGAQA